MCLLHLCAAAAPGRFFVVTVDHGLRPEAAGETLFVKEQCDRLGVNCEIYRADISALAKSTSESTETAGRKFRRKLMAEIVSAGRADVIFTAHHADDNAETVLMHMLRGSGGRGLTGMKTADGFLVRPLLSCTRAEIDAFNAAHGIKFVTDPTNSDSRYTRNFIRNEVLPLLNTRFSATSALNRLARAASADEEFIGRFISREHIRCSDGEVRLAEAAFSEPALAPRYVFEALKLMGAEDYDSVTAARAIGLIGCGAGKKATLAGGITAVRDYDGIAFYREAAKNDAATPFTGAGRYEKFGMEVAVCAPQAVKGAQRFDLNAVPDGAEVRYRRDGDVFRPFGSGGKKLKEYLIDKKIPARIRDKLPLICYNNEVLVVCGVEISDRVRLKCGSAAAEIVFTGETPWKNLK